MTTLLNIGLNVGGKPTWSATDVAMALTVLDIGHKEYITKRSETEETAVIALGEPLTVKQADALCYILKQDCIAQQLEDGTGMLYGPKAEEWGPFNPEYFLTFDKENQDEND